MLSKLIKHEWKSTWKLPVSLCIFVLIMTGLGCLSFRLPMWRALADERFNSFTFLDLLAVGLLITYFLSIMISGVAVTIYFAIRYYKNLFTKEGYLTHTLPVTSGQLILSKGLVSIFWNLVLCLLIIVSVYILLYAFLRSLLPAELWEEFLQKAGAYLPEMEAVFKQYSGMNFAAGGIFFLLFMAISSFFSTVQIYLCISIGQLFQKHKVAASIVAYLVVTTILQLLATVAVLPFSFQMILNMERKLSAHVSPVEGMMIPMASVMAMFYISGILYLLLGIGYYFFTRYLNSNKLNLD